MEKNSNRPPADIQEVLAEAEMTGKIKPKGRGKKTILILLILLAVAVLAELLYINFVINY